MKWLRRLLGESAEVRELRARLAAAEAEIAGLRKGQASLDRLLHQMLEPAPGNQCTKIRLRDEHEAEAFARKVERDSGRIPGSLMAYRCRICPRHPLTGARHYHVTHRDREERGKRGAQYWTREKSANLIARRIDPTVIADLKARLQGGDAA